MKTYASRNAVPRNPKKPTRSRVSGRQVGLASAAVAAASCFLGAHQSKAATFTWDGGGVSGTNLDTAVNWNPDGVPNGSSGDIALWNGTVLGDLSLTYTAAGTGINLSAGTGVFLNLSSGQTSALTINEASGTAGLRLQSISIANGAGAFTFGNSSASFLTLGSGSLLAHTFTNDSTNAATIASNTTFGFGGSGAHTVTVTGAGNWNFAPKLGTGGGSLSVLTKLGVGTLSFTGATGGTGQSNIGTFNAGGGRTQITTGGAITAGFISVGSVAGAGAAFYQSGTSVVTNTSTAGGGFQIGSAPGAYGYYNMTGGTINLGGELDPGGSGGGAGTFGQLDLAGGTINLPNITGTYVLPNRGGAGEASVTNIAGTLQVIGGATPANNGINGLSVGLGNVGNLVSTVTISGSGQFLTPSLTVKLNNTNFGGTTGNATNVSVLNLNGGTLQTLGFGTAINQASGAVTGNANAVLNFNGGTLKAGTANNTSFLTLASGGLSAVNIYNGGGAIDNNGRAINIAVPLVGTDGTTGVGTLTLASGGTGYVTPPQVTFTGGTTTGGILSDLATGYATVNAAGQVTGIVITSPGSYSVAPTGITLNSSSGSGASATIATTVANASGTLAFQGVGITTLSGVNTYLGATNVNAGTLLVNGSTAAGSTVNVASAASLGGGIGGTAGTINGNVTSAGTILPGGLGAVGTLALSNNLTLSGGTIGLDLNASTGSTGGINNDLITIANALTLNGNVLVSPTFIGGTPAVNTQYVFGTYGSLAGSGSLVAGSRATSISTSGGNLVLTYTGATSNNLRWNSTGSGAWDVVTTKNWFNLNTSLQDFFYQADGVTFDDTAGVATAIGVNTIVNPGFTNVSSSTNNYSFSGTGTIGGTGALTKSGSSTLTLATSNSYSGGTVVNGGAVSVSADNNLGATGSALALNGGTLISTLASGVFTDTHPITIGAGGGTINVSSPAQFYLPTANLLLGNGPLSVTGAGTLVPTGVGNLRIGATNSYVGAVAVNNGGSFEYGVASAIGTGSTFNVGNEGEVIAQTGVTVPLAITVNGGTNSTISFENGNTGNYSGGSITLNANAVIGLRDWYNYATVRSGTINDVISGTGGIQTSAGSATTGNPVLTLNNTNTYTGATIISANTTLQLGDGVTDGFITSTTGVTDNGTLTLNRVATTSTIPYAISGTGALIKSGLGSVTLTASNSYAGATTLNAGTIVVANASALPATTTVTIPGTAVAASNVSIDFALDTDSTGFNISSGTGSIFNLVTDRATPGAGVTHTIPLAAFGGGTVNVSSGANVTSGTGTLAIPALQLNAGSVQTTLLNPTNATVAIGSVTVGLNNQFKTLGLGGTTTGNTVTGPITNGVGTVAVAMSGTGNWTLSGAGSTYTGGTSVTAGSLIVSSTGSLGAGNVSVGAATLTLSNGTAISDSATLTVNSSGGSIVNLNAANGTSEVVTALFNLATNSTFNTPGTYSASDLNNTYGFGSVFASGSGETLTITAAAPEPTSLLLAGLAAAPLTLGRRRRRAQGVVVR